METLENKNAIVTGGSRGIGLAIVQAFLSQGANVLTCGRGTRPTSLPESAQWHSVDVSDADSVNDLKRRVEDEFQQLSVLVNNAGVQLEKTVLETSDEDWDHLMGINTRGVFLVTRAMIPLMRENASIINMGSVSGEVADPAMAIYNASKAFVHSLTRSIAVDHGPNIRCNAISPGWIQTAMVDDAFAAADDPEEARNDALRRHPVARLGRPEDVAELAVWLASDASGFATGQCYVLDGGLTAASPLRPGLF